MVSSAQLGLLRLGNAQLGLGTAFTFPTAQLNSQLGVLQLGLASLGSARIVRRPLRADMSAQLGRLRLGNARLGDAYVLLNRVLFGALTCNGAATTQFLGRISVAGRFVANGIATCVWTAAAGSGSIHGSFECDGKASMVVVMTTQGIAGRFECDGHADIHFISSGGAVAITCIDTGDVGMGGPALGAIDALYDLPYSY